MTQDHIWYRLCIQSFLEKTCRPYPYFYKDSPCCYETVSYQPTNDAHQSAEDVDVVPSVEWRRAPAVVEPKASVEEPRQKIYPQGVQSDMDAIDLN